MSHSIGQALDAGITFFDTAEMYSDGRSETFFGHALRKLLPSSRFTAGSVVMKSGEREKGVARH